MRPKHDAAGKRPPRPIAFRLPSPYFEQLSALAAERNLSPGQCARELVAEALIEDNDQEILSRLDRICTAIATLDEHLAAATVAVLHDAGKAELQEAVRWVHQNLTSESLTQTYPSEQ